MRVPWSEKFTSQRSLLLVVFLTSFFVGAVSGAVFGLVGATMLAEYMPPSLSTFVPRRLALPSSPASDETAAPGEAPSGVVEVVRRATPAVVSLVITKDVPKLQPFNSFGSPFSNDFFNEFFGLPRQPAPSEPPATEKRRVGGGSGFFVSSDGLIVTNKHVVADADAEYTVLLNNGRQYQATVVSRDPSNDLAVVKVTGQGFPTLPLGDSSALALGETVIAIGNALGEFRNTVSTGVVSGLSRSVTASGSALGPEELTGVIQTDAAINPGNSGGPLLNLDGEVVGVNTAVAQGAENIGFAIPVNDLKAAIESVKRHGRIVRPFLGIRYVAITSDLAKEKQLPVDYGALIVRGDTPTDLAVTPGSPADKAGLLENDIILEVGGQRITADHPLVKVIARYGVGDRVSMRVLRRGETKDVAVTLAERK